MEKVIIQNGGVVIDSVEEAAIIIQEDGYDPKIWQHDAKTQSFVHFRFIQECIAQNNFLSHEDGLYLCPLPQAIPVRIFSKIAIEFSLVTNELDELVFGELIKLYGIKRGFRE